MRFLLAAIISFLLTASTLSAADYDGKYCRGTGDPEFLQLIDRSFDFFYANPSVQNISMLYRPDWNCLVEGPGWQGWWTQNSFGPTYCVLPFLQEPYLTLLQTSHDFWWKWQGDGKTVDMHGLTGPDGCLSDASADWTSYAQGDLVMMYPGTQDWGYGFTASVVIMQAQLLLITRDIPALKKYLPQIERAVAFVETVRDPKNDLFLVGPGADLLSPAYGGIKKPDGTAGKAYLSELSIHQLTALELTAELEKLAGSKDKARRYSRLADKTRKSISQFLTKEGYFVKCIDPNGTIHGLLSQDKFNYYDTTPNIDAVAFRAVDNRRAQTIASHIDSIPQLRPHTFMLPNWPGLDDTWEFWGIRDINAPPFEKFWEIKDRDQRAVLMYFGNWVNGGVWLTLEARVILSYYRTGRFDDVRRSGLKLMEFARTFDLDAPLVDFGRKMWNNKPVTFCYDSLGVPAAVLRGLFEYIYSSDSLTLYPHIPPTINEFHQKHPVRFGQKQLTISVINNGPKIKIVKVNGKKVSSKSEYVTLPYDRLPANAHVEITMTGKYPKPTDRIDKLSPSLARLPDSASLAPLPEDMSHQYALLEKMQKSLQTQPGAVFEKAFISEAIAAYDAYRARAAADAAGSYNHLSAEKRTAILNSYQTTAKNMFSGLDILMKTTDK